MADLREQLDELLKGADDEILPVTSGEMGNGFGLWAESTELGVIIHCQAEGVRLTFGTTKAQARHLAYAILRAAGVQ